MSCSDDRLGWNLPTTKLRERIFFWNVDAVLKGKSALSICWNGFHWSSLLFWRTPNLMSVEFMGTLTTISTTSRNIWTCILCRVVSENFLLKPLLRSEASQCTSFLITVFFQNYRLLRAHTSMVYRTFRLKTIFHRQRWRNSNAFRGFSW